jgi:uncharacterized protein
MICFVDTSALLAVLDRADAAHDRAKAAWECLMASKTPLVTTNYVLVETVAILQHRLGLPAVRAFSADICPVLTIEWVTAERHAKGLSALLAADRRKLSLVDCVSFNTMRERGIQKALAFDGHFDEQGFDTDFSSNQLEKSR